MAEPNCLKCGLCNSCKTAMMQPDLRHVSTEKPCQILVIGEAPGAEEDSVGTPFVGQSGRLLREVMSEEGLADYGVAFTNVVHCRPPENRTPSVSQIKSCMPLLQQEIEDLNPRLIILAGNTPLKAVLGETGITNWQGVLIEQNGRAYLPVYHPAYILRNPEAINDFAAAMIKAAQYMENGSNALDVLGKYTIKQVRTTAEAQAMADDLLQAEVVAFDTESNISVEPFSEGTHPIACSFAAYPNNTAYAVVLGPATSDIVLQVLQSDIPKLLHNAKYDYQVILAEYGARINNIVGDSMLLSYVLDSTPGRHGLKELAGRYLGMYEYDYPLREYYAEHPDADPSKKGDMSRVPHEILLEYAAYDAVATLELHRVLDKELEPHQRALYQELIIPASNALAVMECNGVKLDVDVIKYYRALYKSVQRQKYAAMLAYPEVQKYLKNVEMDTFNPNSTVQMKIILFDKKHFGLKPKVMTATGEPSTSWDSISGHADACPFVKEYRYYKLLGKMLSTYIEPAEGWLGRDNRVHASYLLHGTATGRLASRRPNLQNIPTPEKEPDTLLAVHPIKNIFTNTWEGGCLLAVDYSGMELRTMASVAGVEGMLQAFREGKDVHSVVTCALFHYTYEEFIAKKKAGDQDAIAQRYRAKWVNWTLLYGGSEYTLMNLYGLPEDEAKALVKQYYTMFPEILDNREKVLKLARKNGYIESMFGRRRYLPYINDRDNSRRSSAEREAVNMPIQSAASDILVCGLVVLNDLMQQNGFKSLLVNTVHDSVMFDVYPGELDDLAWLVREVLENIPTKYGPEWFPGLDFTWFTCPLEIDAEFGTHYGCLEHYKYAD